MPGRGHFASGGHIGVDVPDLDTRSGEGIALELVVLSGGADTGVSENCHDRSLPRKPPNVCLRHTGL